MTDINESFHQERIGQIAFAESAAERAMVAQADQASRFDARVAEGKLKDLGNGRFKVTDPNSYDDGEVLFLRNVNINGVEQRIVLPEHGLDTTTGKAALYSKVPVWHNLGTVVPEGLTNIDDVLDAAGLNYSVEKRQQIYTNPVTGEVEEMPGKFTTHRMDNGKGLGNVGSIFEVMQNRESFEFLEALIRSRRVNWESAGALREGRRTFVSMRLPESIIIDSAGVADEIIPFVVALNSHDGTGKFEVIVTPWRPVCGNTERFAVRDAVVRWGTRHTTNTRDKVADAQLTLSNSVKYFEKFAAEENQLAQTELKWSEIDQIINEIYGLVDGDSSKKAQATRKALTESLAELHVPNVATLGQTAYAFERTITEHTDWKRNLRPRSGELKGKDALIRATAVLEDNGGKTKTAAHKRLMLRVNA